MKRFVFLLATLFLIFTACDNSRFKDVFSVDLKDALIFSESEPLPMTIDSGRLVFSERRSDSYWYLRLEIPNMGKINLGPEHEHYQAGDHYVFSNGKERIELGCGETPFIWATLSSGSKFEYSPDKKTARKIKETIEKSVFSSSFTFTATEVTFPVEAVDSLAELEFPEVAVPIEEEMAVEEEGLLVGNASSPRLFQEVEDVQTDGDGELYVGAYTSAKTGIVRKFSIYEDWMLEHFDSAVEPRKYFYKGMTTYEGKSYRYYGHDDDYYILVSPDTDVLVMFWAFTFNGNKSNNVTRYAKGDRSSPSAPPTNMDNSYQQLQQQQYYQQQQKMQREQMYLSQYRTWENTVISNYNTLMSMRDGAARTSVRMNFRNGQSEMRQVRMNAQVEGIHIMASAWETASVPLGYE